MTNKDLHKPFPGDLQKKAPLFCAGFSKRIMEITAARNGVFYAGSSGI
jgi:hypothetical protein